MALDASASAQQSTSAQSPTAKAPAPPALHAAAQHGNLAALQELLDGGTSAKETDAIQITALHWAAINGHLLACKTLLNAGAEVDAIGGDLRATPMQWAARNGHVYIVHLLITHGADPALKDSQGFNTLHLATHSSAPLLLLYLLSQQLPLTVDSEDGAGRTSIMWAAYQGDSLSVELLLNFGADPNKTDPQGLSALHWAVVKGNVSCIAQIIKAGADIWAKNGEGQTPLDLAKQLSSVPAWNRAMATLGRENDGRLRGRPLNERNTRVAIYGLPFATLGICFKTLETLPWYTGLPLALAEAFAMHHVVVRVLLDSAVDGGMSTVQTSPYLFGIVSASMFWVGYAWITRLVSNTPGMAYTNVFFAVALAFCSYNLFRTATLDPGFVPKSQSDSLLKDTVESLTRDGRLNGQNLCLECLVRRPVRSRHDRISKRCVAKFDHYCPWAHNAIGVNNHRQFILFVGSLIVGVILYLRLAWFYFGETAPNPADVNATTCLFPSQSFCASAASDTFVFSIGAWAMLQLSWTFLVLGGQVWQISRQLTTYELSNLGRYGYMGGRGQSLAGQEGHASHRHHAPAPATDAEDAPSGHRHAHHHHHHPRGCLGICKACASKALPGALLSVVGLDLYTKGKAADGMARARQNSSANPFDLGLWRNCTDFWTRGRTLGVDYTQLFDVPDGGFKTVLQSRSREAKSKSGLDQGPRYTMIPSSSGAAADV